MHSLKVPQGETRASESRSPAAPKPLQLAAVGAGFTDLLVALVRRRTAFAVWFAVGTGAICAYIVLRPEACPWVFTAHVTMVEDKANTEHLAEGLVRFTANEIAAAEAANDGRVPSLGEARISYPEIRVGRTLEPLKSTFIVTLESTVEAGPPEALKALAIRVKHRAQKLSANSLKDAQEALAVINATRDATAADANASIAERSGIEVARAMLAGRLTDRPECEVSPIVRGTYSAPPRLAQFGLAALGGLLIAAVMTLVPYLYGRLRQAAN